MNRLSKNHLILTILLIPLMVLSSCSFAGRYNWITPVTRPTYIPIPTAKPVLMPTKPTTPTTPTNSVPISNTIGPKKSTYYWGKFDTSTINSYIDGASINGIGIIYLDLEPYAYNITVAQAIKELAPVVQYAKSKNVLIYALIGAPTFAQPNERQYILKVMEIIKQFNSSQPTPIAGIHLNIEFYLVPAFKADTGTTVKNSILVNYLDFHKTIGDLTRTIQATVPSFELSSTLPHFTDFEGSDNPIPFINYDNSRLSVFEQVAKVLNSTPNSTIVIMSYRSTPTGVDSISGLVKKEFELVSKYKTKITIGVEIHDEKSTYISMYGKTKSEINSIINQVSDVYRSSPNFGGIAIHELKAYLIAK
jgi:hypothetical protein